MQEMNTIQPSPSNLQRFHHEGHLHCWHLLPVQAFRVGFHMATNRLSSIDVHSAAASDCVSYLVGIMVKLIANELAQTSTPPADV